MNKKMEAENMDFLKLKFEKENQRLKDERIAKIKEHWENLPIFENPEDVPDIPRVNPEEYRNFYVPRLIKAGAIPKVDLIDEQCYLGDHRKARVAKWNAEKNVFEYWRHKFGVFLDECNHFEDDNGFALFVPIKLATEDQFIATKG